MALRLEKSDQVRVNTDPQRRCYNGAHFSSELRWSAWDWLQWDVPPDRVAERLKFWRDLSTYSVSVGGSPSRYRVRDTETDKEIES